MVAELIAGQVPAGLIVAIGIGDQRIGPLHGGVDGDHLAPDPGQRRARKRPVMARKQLAQDPCFAAGHVTSTAGYSLGGCDLGDDAGAAQNQFMHRRVDSVDFTAQVFQGLDRFGHARIALLDTN